MDTTHRPGSDPTRHATAVEAPLKAPAHDRGLRTGHALWKPGHLQALNHSAHALGHDSHAPARVRPLDAPPPGSPRAITPGTGPVAARHMLQGSPHRAHHAGLHPANQQTRQAPPATSTCPWAAHHRALCPQRQPLRHWDNVDSRHHNNAP